MLKEIAMTEAAKLKDQNPKFCFIHRKDGDIDFINTFLKEMETIQVNIIFILVLKHQSTLDTGYIGCGGNW